MRMVVVSDIHLCARFDKKRFDLLKGLFLKADIIVLNGDFWDAYSCSFESFINSEWAALFPLLKKRKTYYLFGNHDSAIEHLPHASDIFGQMQKSLDIEVGPHKFHIRHGNFLAPQSDERGGAVHRIFGNLPSDYGARLTCLVYKLGGRGFYKFMNQKFNEQMKAWSKENLPSNTILVCGHSHVPEMSLDENYINIGAIDCGQCDYLEVSPEKINLHIGEL